MVESKRLQNGELLGYSSHQQDTGIKHRVTVKPPIYRNKYEFLNEVETSDEEVDAVEEAALAGA